MMGPRDDVMHDDVDAAIRRYARKLRVRLARRRMTPRLKADVLVQLLEHEDWRAKALAVDILSDLLMPVLGLRDKRRAKHAWLWP